MALVFTSPHPINCQLLLLLPGFATLPGTFLGSFVTGLSMIFNSLSSQQLHSLLGVEFRCRSTSVGSPVQDSSESHPSCLSMPTSWVCHACQHLLIRITNVTLTLWNEFPNIYIYMYVYIHICIHVFFNAYFRKKMLYDHFPRIKTHMHQWKVVIFTASTWMFFMPRRLRKDVPTFKAAGLDAGCVKSLGITSWCNWHNDQKISMMKVFSFILKYVGGIRVDEAMMKCGYQVEIMILQHCNLDQW